MASNIPQPQEIYGIFAGGIDTAAVQRFGQAVATAIQNKIERVHLFFQSFGGNVGDGVALYNLFKACPFELTIYNPGQIASIGVIAYLGAQKRKTSASATFSIHRTQSSPQYATAGTLKTVAESVALDDRRTEAILRGHISIPDERWTHLNHYDVWFSAEEAVQFGLAQEIGDFSPPIGSAVFSI